jgi:hypothetical protein
MSRSFTGLCYSGAWQPFSRRSALSNQLPSEAAIVEIRPGGPITVTKYRSLQAFVSAVNQGFSPTGDVTGEAGISLRLVSFLEETRRRTWLSMRAVLSRYAVVPVYCCMFVPLISRDIDC